MTTSTLTSEREAAHKKLAADTAAANALLARDQITRPEYDRSTQAAHTDFAETLWVALQRAG